MSKSIKITRFCHIEARGALDAHFGSEKQKSHLCSLFGAENAVLRPVAYKLEGRRAQRRSKAAKPGLEPRAIPTSCRDEHGEAPPCIFSLAGICQCRQRRSGEETVRPTLGWEPVQKPGPSPQRIREPEQSSGPRARIARTGRDGTRIFSRTSLRRHRCL